MRHLCSISSSVFGYSRASPLASRWLWGQPPRLMSCAVKSGSAATAPTSSRLMATRAGRAPPPWRWPTTSACRWSTHSSQLTMPCGARAYAMTSRLIASGKIATGGEVATHIALGADLVHIGRGFLFSIGCIQAMRCHTNTCPTGVTTQNRWLQSGLDPDGQGRASPQLRACPRAGPPDDHSRVRSDASRPASPRSRRHEHLAGSEKVSRRAVPVSSRRPWRARREAQSRRASSVSTAGLLSGHAFPGDACDGRLQDVGRSTETLARFPERCEDEYMKLRGPILVGTDFSAASDEALRQGNVLANDLGTNPDRVPCRARTRYGQYPVSTIGRPQRGAPSRSSLTRPWPRSNSQVATSLGDAANVRAVVDSGTPHAGLLTQADATKARVSSSWDRAEPQTEWSRHATVPTLIARHSPRGIVIGATDFSDPSLPALEAAAAEARRRGSRLQLLHVVDVGTFALAGPAAAGGLPFVHWHSRHLAWSDRRSRTAARTRLGEALTRSLSMARRL